MKLNEIYKMNEAMTPDQQLKQRVLRMLDKALVASKDPIQAANAIRSAATEINVTLNMYCNELIKGGGNK